MQLNDTIAKRLIRAAFGIAVVCAAFIIIPSSAVNAQTSGRVYSIDKLSVDIEVNKDSSMLISESLDYTFNGSFNGMFREIRLDSPQNKSLCLNNASLQCGGFDFIEIQQVKVDEQVVANDRFDIERVTTNGEPRLRVQYRFDNVNKQPVFLINEKHNFTLTYKVYGALGLFTDYDLFYWNAVFADRDVNIAGAEVKVTYPGEVILDPENTTIFSDLSQGTDYNAYHENNTSTYIVGKIPAYIDFTIAQKMPKGLMTAPGQIELITPVWLGDLDISLVNSTTPTGDKSYTNLKINTGDLLYTQNSDKNGSDLLRSIPVGKYKLEASSSGYKPRSYDATVTSGQTTSLEVQLDPEPLAIAGIMAVACANLFCLIGAFALVVWAIMHWQVKGRDQGRDQVIIPEYSIPADMPPYLLGALKDERVDSIDITASIIDLAYRGHLKITAVENARGKITDYQLDKISSDASASKQAGPALDAFEEKLMSALFKSGERVQLNKIKLQFSRELPALKISGYDQLVEHKYFAKRPDKVRNNWMGFGIAGSTILFVISIFLVNVFVVTGFCLSVVIGLVGVVGARFMPARTALGKELLAKVWGFKMYLETAEKYTLQNLTPEMFEKYLSYAIVFGIEKKWAEKFADMYLPAPSWYSGSSLNTFSPVLFAGALRSFSTTSNSTLNYTPPSSSGSSSGGGWSGGGGFSGGFSGGGGGGGGGGAW